MTIDLKYSHGAETYCLIIASLLKYIGLCVILPMDCIYGWNNSILFSLTKVLLSCFLKQNMPQKAPIN